MRSLFVIALVACGSRQDTPPAQPLPEAKRAQWVDARTGKPVDPPPPGAHVEYIDARTGKPIDPAKLDDPPPAPEAKKPAAKGSVADQFVEAHNRFRAKHCAPPLTWSKKLADVAQDWADELKKKGCMFGHSPGMKYGENLGAGSIGALDPSSTVEMWYDEIKKYKFPNGGFSMQTGHFTQLVWRDTRQVGCGHVQCKGNDIYVCEYDPPGNVEGEWRTQVLPTSCKK
jgi:hypothetical protein